MAGAHPVYRKITLDKRARADIFHISTIQSTFLQILSNFRLFDSTTGIDNNYKNPSPVNPLFKKQDIYNIKTQICQNILRLLTSIQALLRKLNKGNWMYTMQKNDQNRIIHLFFVKSSTQNILITNYKILVIYCTYKTNQYRMPLMIISRQTFLNSNFYIVFCFMAHKTQIDYA